MSPELADGTDATPPPVSTQTTRGYTGHKMDAEVGLINMNARLYDPILGHFISADTCIDDPQDMQTFNRYSYVTNNPLKNVDLTGYAGESPQGGSADLGTIYVYANLEYGGSLSYAGTFSTWNRGWFYYDIPFGLSISEPPSYSPNLNSQNDWQPNIDVRGAWNGRTGNLLATGGLYDPSQTAGNSPGIEHILGGAAEMFPFVGAASSVYELATGTNFFTGEAVTPLMAIAGITPWGRAARKIDRVYTLYHGVDSAGKLRYVGITGRDPNNRFAEHLNAIGTGKEALDYRAVSSGLTRREARMHEQLTINQFGLEKNGGQLLNKINSIAPSKWNQFGIE